MPPTDLRLLLLELLGAGGKVLNPLPCFLQGVSGITSFLDSCSGFRFIFDTRPVDIKAAGNGAEGLVLGVAMTLNILESVDTGEGPRDAAVDKTTLSLGTVDGIASRARVPRMIPEFEVDSA